MWSWALTLLDFIAGYTQLASVLAGILTWEYFTKTKLSAEVKWELYGGAFLAVSFFNWRAITNKAKAAELALANQVKKAERIFAEEPEAILAHIATMRLTDTLFTQNCDKWVTVTGTFEGIADSLLGDSIHLSLILKRGQRVNLVFCPDSRDRLQSLREGQQLTAVGQVLPRNCSVVLGHAELIRVKPLLARVS